MSCNKNKIFLLLYITIHNAQTEATIFDKRNQGIVDITNYSFPNDTSEIRFGHNNIEKVPRGVFKNTPSLWKITLGNNFISVLEEGAFINVSSLQILYLHQNGLKFISKMMFTGLSELTHLNLQSNDISYIENQSFGMLNNLAVLKLSDNELKTLSECIFDGISQRNISVKLSLYGNSLQCDKRLCWVQPDWINLVNPEDTYCAGPEALISITWDMVLEDDLNCHSKYTQFDLYGG